jgi:hypothetical protein
MSNWAMLGKRLRRDAMRLLKTSKSALLKTYREMLFKLAIIIFRAPRESVLHKFNIKGFWGFGVLGFWGLGDPAESYVRMAKHRSSTTTSSVQVDGVGIYEGAVGIRMRGEFNPVAHALHQYVGGRAREFSQILKDPNFIKRMKTYFTGSYLREIALTNVRGSAEGGLLAMIMAGESLTGPVLAHHAAA